MNKLGEWIWLKDRLVKRSDFDQPTSETVNRIYEVLRVVNGKPLFLDDHYNRFLESCKKLNVQTELTIESILASINAVISISNSDNCNIRFEEVIEDNSVSYACYLVPFSYPKPKAYKNGVSLGTYRAERPNPHIKQSVVNNSIRQALSSIYDRDKVFEVLLIDHNNCITEGSRTNILFIKNNTIISPPTEHILEGITRKKVLEIATKMAIEIKEQSINLNDIEKYDACFLTGTSPKALPVNRIGQAEFKTDHPLLREIMSKYDTLINENCG